MKETRSSNGRHDYNTSLYNRSQGINKGTLEFIFLTPTVSFTIPRHDRLTFHSNKEFIGCIALTYHIYKNDLHHNIMKDVNAITPQMLAKYFRMYDIRTNKGELYTLYSRGPFNLIRAAYNHYLNKEIEELKKARNSKDKMFRAVCRNSAKHYAIIKGAIAHFFVDRNGNHAWEC